MIGGRTRLAAVIGAPIAHSMSPAILNAAFAARGLDWVYLAFEVPEGGAGRALDAVRALGIEGLSVTMPHKAAVIPGLDRLDEDAEALGAVNCVWRDGGRLVGSNTDGAGFVDALRVDHGVDPAGRRCLVVGAGGAGRSVARALGLAGASEVVVVNRSEGPARHAASLAGPAGRVGTAAEAADADLVVNATPLGMGAPAASGTTPDPLPIDPGGLGPGQVVADLVYHPLETPLLVAARARGATVVDGLGMLVHQAGHAFRRWTAQDPPLAEMSRAARTAISRPAGEGSCS
ncbi:MAG: shikimate dehydrogenase [Acidimicrobiia bacterium]